ncbi:hypothetical protein BJ742DRAFT_476115 [Cladochytrium replicatum]|nr:hypothetical protein BJ742DRAFT_476115 [Cladochytrium replicatum]
MGQIQGVPGSVQTGQQNPLKQAIRPPGGSDWRTPHLESKREGTIALVAKNLQSKTGGNLEMTINVVRPVEKNAWEKATSVEEYQNELRKFATILAGASSNTAAMAPQAQALLQSGLLPVGRGAPTQLLQQQQSVNVQSPQPPSNAVQQSQGLVNPSMTGQQQFLQQLMASSAAARPGMTGGQNLNWNDTLRALQMGKQMPQTQMQMQNQTSQQIVQPNLLSAQQSVSQIGAQSQSAQIQNLLQQQQQRNNENASAQQAQIINQIANFQRQQQQMQQAATQVKAENSANSGQLPQPAISGQQNNLTMQPPNAAINKMQTQVGSSPSVPIQRSASATDTAGVSRDEVMAEAQALFAEAQESINMNQFKPLGMDESTKDCPMMLPPMERYIVQYDQLVKIMLRYYMKEDPVKYRSEVRQRLRAGYQQSIVLRNTLKRWKEQGQLLLNKEQLTSINQSMLALFNDAQEIVQKTRQSDGSSILSSPVMQSGSVQNSNTITQSSNAISTSSSSTPLAPTQPLQQLPPAILSALANGKLNQQMVSQLLASAGGGAQVQTKTEETSARPGTGTTQQNAGRVPQITAEQEQAAEKALQRVEGFKTFFNAVRTAAFNGDVLSDMEMARTKAALVEFLNQPVSDATLQNYFMKRRAATNGGNKATPTQFNEVMESILELVKPTLDKYGQAIHQLNVMKNMGASLASSSQAVPQNLVAGGAMNNPNQPNQPSAGATVPPPTIPARPPSNPANQLPGDSTSIVQTIANMVKSTGMQLPLGSLAQMVTSAASTPGARPLNLMLAQLQQQQQQLQQQQAQSQQTQPTVSQQTPQTLTQQQLQQMIQQQQLLLQQQQQQIQGQTIKPETQVSSTTAASQAASSSASSTSKTSARQKKGSEKAAAPEPKLEAGGNMLQNLESGSAASIQSTAMSLGVVEGKSVSTSMLGEKSQEINGFGKVVRHMKVVEDMKQYAADEVVAFNKLVTGVGNDVARSTTGSASTPAPVAGGDGRPGVPVGTYFNLVDDYVSTVSDRRARLGMTTQTNAVIDGQTVAEGKSRMKPGPVADAIRRLGYSSFVDHGDTVANFWVEAIDQTIGRPTKDKSRSQRVPESLTHSEEEAARLQKEDMAVIFGPSFVASPPQSPGLLRTAGSVPVIDRKRSLAGISISSPTTQQKGGLDYLATPLADDLTVENNDPQVSEDSVARNVKRNRLGRISNAESMDRGPTSFEEEFRLILEEFGFRCMLIHKMHGPVELRKENSDNMEVDKTKTEAVSEDTIKDDAGWMVAASQSTGLDGANSPPGLALVFRIESRQSYLGQRRSGNKVDAPSTLNGLRGVICMEVMSAGEFGSKQQDASSTDSASLLERAQRSIGRWLEQPRVYRCSDLLEFISERVIHAAPENSF